MDTSDQRLVVYPDAVSLAILGLASLGFVILGVLVFFAGMRRGIDFFLIGIIAGDLALFGSGVLFSARTLLSRRPLLIVDQEGIVDRASPFGVGLVRWEEIADMDSFEAGVPYLRIVPKDPKGFVSRQPLVRRILMKTNLLLFRAPLLIPETLLSVPVSDILSWVREARHLAPGGSTGIGGRSP